jgi:hypothetical protein
MNSTDALEPPKVLIFIPKTKLLLNHIKEPMFLHQTLKINHLTLNIQHYQKNVHRNHRNHWYNQKN